MLLSSAQKVIHYTQYYVHSYCNYAIVHAQLFLLSMITLAIVRLKPVVLYIYYYICYAAVLLYFTLYYYVQYYGCEKICAAFCIMLT